MEKTILISDLFSFDEKGIFGRAFANRGVLKSILECQSVKTVLCLNPVSKFQSQHKIKGLEKLQPIKSSLELLQHLKSGQIDAVFCSDFITYYADWVHLRNQLQLEFPVFGITHSLSYLRFTESFIKILLARPNKQDSILCTSDSAISVVANIFNEVKKSLKEDIKEPSSSLFPLPFDLENFELKAKKGPLKALYLGRLDWQTKADLLILKKIIPKLESEISFVVAGGADSEEYISLLKAELEPLGVEILLNISEEEKHSLLQESHFLVSPSDNYQETYGLSVIEAMLYGLIPIISDFNGYRNFIENGQNGFLIPSLAAPLNEELQQLKPLVSEASYHGWLAGAVSFDPKSFAEKLNFLIQNPIICKDMSQQAREKAENYSISNLSHKVEKLIERKAKENPKNYEYPFNWCFEKIFKEHPNQWWKNQSVSLSENGEDFLNNPTVLPQMRLYPAIFDFQDFRKTLFMIKRKKSVQSCIEKGIDPIILSICLKNDLINWKAE